MRTKEEIFEAIQNWEIEAGESFVDYFDCRLNSAFYNGFLLGKGFVEHSNKICSEMNTSGKYYSNNDGIVEIYPEYEGVNEYGDPQSIEENYNKNIELLAEFISLTDVYQERFNKFLEEN